MLGDEVEVAGVVGRHEFAGGVGTAVDRVVHFGRAHLHGFDRHVVDRETHLGMRRRHHQHAADAAGQPSGLTLEGPVHGTADQTGVVLGAIADVWFHAWIPVQGVHQCGGEFQPDAERAGDCVAEQPGQQRFGFDPLMLGGRVEGGGRLACGNRHGGHVVGWSVVPSARPLRIDAPIVLRRELWQRLNFTHTHTIGVTFEQAIMPQRNSGKRNPETGISGMPADGPPSRDSRFRSSSAGSTGPRFWRTRRR